MSVKATIYSASGAVSGGGILIRGVEVTPTGGTLEVRLLRGSDTTGTEIYRIRAQESSEFRDFGEGIIDAGPIYAYFYDGTGALTVLT